MKLFYTPGTSSLAVHIALCEAGIPFTLERVDIYTKQTQSGGDYWKINAKGYTPSLLLDTGEFLTEGAVILQYVADQKPEAALAPRAGTMERFRLQEWLHFMATEIHKPLSILYLPSDADFKGAIVTTVASRLSFMARALANRKHLLDQGFTVADAYAFYIIRFWQTMTQRTVSEWPELSTFYALVAERAGVIRALTEEGLSP